MAFWRRKQEDIISCECGEGITLNRERLPRGYYYATAVADCPECGAHYERSPTGHLYLTYDLRRSYDSMMCAEDRGSLERVVHSFRTLFGSERWEFIVYCPRHEENPASFLEGISEVPEPFDADGAMAAFASWVMGASYRRSAKKTGQESDSSGSE